MAKEEYDLVVIGGGSAGLVATAGPALFGARVALVEKDKLFTPHNDLWKDRRPESYFI